MPQSFSDNFNGTYTLFLKPERATNDATLRVLVNGVEIPELGATTLRVTPTVEAASGSECRFPEGPVPAGEWLTVNCDINDLFGNPLPGRSDFLVMGTVVLKDDANQLSQQITGGEDFPGGGSGGGVIASSDLLVMIPVEDTHKIPAAATLRDGGDVVTPLESTEDVSYAPGTQIVPAVYNLVAKRYEVLSDEGVVRGYVYNMIVLWSSRAGPHGVADRQFCTQGSGLVTF